MTRVSLGITSLLALLLALAVAVSFTLSQTAVAQVTPQTHEQDFSIVKTANKKKAKKGALITYTLTASNTTTDASTANSASVVDTLGPGQKLRSVTVTEQPSGPESSDFTCTTSGNTVTCESPVFGGSPDPTFTDTATIQIVAKKTKKGAITNTAEIIAPNDDTADNNTSSVTVKGKKKGGR